LLHRAGAFDARLLGLYHEIGRRHRSIRLRLGGLALHPRILRSDRRRLWVLLRCGLRLLDTLIRLRLGLCRLPTQLRHLFGLARHCLGGRRSLDLVRLHGDLGFWDLGIWSRSRLTLGRGFGFLLFLFELLQLRFRRLGLDRTEQILPRIRLRLELNRVVNRLDQLFALDSCIRQLSKLGPHATENIRLDGNDEQDQVNDDAQHGGELNAAAQRTTLDLPQHPDQRT
jgi:hypothetical protein